MMIICASKDQLDLLQSLPSFEVDMCYKRLRKRGLNEVLFAAWLPDVGRSKLNIYSSNASQGLPKCPRGGYLLKILDIVLCRVFTESEDPEGYFLLFSRVFEVIEKVTGKPLQFQYLHGSGVHAILADMDWSQMKGMLNGYK